MNRFPETTTMNHCNNNTAAEVRPGTVQAMIRRLQQQQQQQQSDVVVLANEPVKMGTINNVFPKDKLPHGQKMTSGGSKKTAFPVVTTPTITNQNMATTTSTPSFQPKIATTTTIQTAQPLVTSESSTNSSLSSSSSESRPQDHKPTTRQPKQAPVQPPQRQEQSTLTITIPRSGWCRGSLCGNNDNDESSVSSLEWSDDEDDEEDRAEYYFQKHLLREQEERRRIMQQHQRQQQLLLHLKHQRHVEQKQHEAEQRRRLALPISTAPHTVPHVHRAQQADPELRRFMMVLAVGTTAAAKAHKAKTRILHPWERRRLGLETRGTGRDHGGVGGEANNNNDDNICRHLSIRTVDGYKLVVYDETRVYIPEALQHDTKKYYYKLEMEETLRLELESSSDEEEDDNDSDDSDGDDTKESGERKPVVPWKDRMKTACFWPDM